jgi:hypothetical protein
VAKSGVSSSVLPVMSDYCTHWLNFWLLSKVEKAMGLFGWNHSQQKLRHKTLLLQKLNSSHLET